MWDTQPLNREARVHSTADDAGGGRGPENCPHSASHNTHSTERPGVHSTWRKLFCHGFSLLRREDSESVNNKNTMSGREKFYPEKYYKVNSERVTDQGMSFARVLKRNAPVQTSGFEQESETQAGIEHTVM